jgi:DNA-binding MarR family transcriptional regulator
VDSDRQALVAAVGAATQAYQRATDAFDDEVGRRLRLNSTDLRCLDWLTVGPRTAGELAVATGLSGAATTSLLDRLEGRGFVRRVRDTGDRRRVVVDLTPEGRQTLWELYGPLARAGEALLARFGTEELARLLTFLADATHLVEERTAGLRELRNR